MDQFDSATYRRSRIAYILQAAFEYLIALMVTNEFLSKLLTHLGASDSLIGIVSSFASLAFLFQLASIPVGKKIKNTKCAVFVFNTLAQVLFMLLYFVPFLQLEPKAKASLAVCMIILAYASQYLISPILFKWANSYTAPNKRGVNGAVREMISLLAGMIFSLAVGAIVDRYDSADRMMDGFWFIAMAMLVLNVCNGISILSIHKEENTRASEAKSRQEILQHTLHNKNFRQVVVLTSLGSIARYLTIGFMGTFKLNDLMISLSLLQVINVVASGIRLFISLPFGRYADKRGYIKAIELAFALMAVGFFLNIFCTRQTWWLVVLFTILYNAGTAGISANSQNIIYNCVPMDFLVPAMSIRAAIEGILGFLTSLVGSALLSHIQNNGNTFLGFHVYGQQVLSLLSFAVLCIAVCYSRLAINPQAIDTTYSRKKHIL